MNATPPTQPTGSADNSRRQVLLRLDPAVAEALARWSADEFRSTNAHIEYLLRQSLREAGRMPSTAAEQPRRGRPKRDAVD